MRKKLDFYSNSIKKLTSLNLDPLKSVLEPYYSKTGRPALNQSEIFRSIILMLDMGETSLKNCVNTLFSDYLLAMLIGFSPNSFPPLGSYYVFPLIAIIPSIQLGLVSTEKLSVAGDGTAILILGSMDILCIQYLLMMQLLSLISHHHFVTLK
ncbi:hypothetical protein AC231_14710 [Clostridium pasteurianum]|uniref:hypothetical protein n=1 Tax=Clostridium pasteurianum TaxID=1501 RepID=UPI0002A76BD4|nr:hypothetical protein [Clostridium pasteurianum]AOZ74096.1 hypothetical protein AQ983_02830 [Clostridium pasteurianum DSM 525 = ATCC 6013]AOZ77893.1 hypothetical protein AQ984_02830 [Clostridium pasteurianum]ELP61255.1 hypothetical protein F502_02330 [Clostridium pasteurianum DSM 525 = ATCC 6013]OMH21676.1 hypothetical protein AC231_14710 [Clostridium pasteurianum]